MCIATLTFQFLQCTNHVEYFAICVTRAAMCIVVHTYYFIVDLEQVSREKTPKAQQLRWLRSEEALSTQR